MAIRARGGSPGGSPGWSQGWVARVVNGKWTSREKMQSRLCAPAPLAWYSLRGYSARRGAGGFTAARRQGTLCPRRPPGKNKVGF